MKNKIIKNDLGQIIYEKDSTGFEIRYEYDEKGRISCQTDSNGRKVWKEYDEETDQLIHEKDTYQQEFWYDLNGNLIRYTNPNSTSYYTYDEAGNMIHSKESIVSEKWYEYDEKGRIIYLKDSKGIEEWIQYNSKGDRLFRRKYSNGAESLSAYNEHSNKISVTEFNQSV